MTSRRPGGSVAIPIALLLTFQLALGTIPVALSRPLLVAIPALVLVILHRRGSPLALWAAYMLALQLHVVIWAAIPQYRHGVYTTYPIALDRMLGLGQVPTLLLQSQRAWTPHALDTLAFGVYITFFTAPLIGFVAAWRVKRHLAATYARAIAATAFLSLIVMALAPTAPPWMAAEQGALPHVERIAEVVVGSAVHQGAESAIRTNTVAAMPSLHSAVTVLAALLAARARPRSRRWVWLYPFAMGLALVYMGEHYVVDVLAGVAMAVLGWRLASSDYGPYARWDTDAADEALPEEEAALLAA